MRILLILATAYFLSLQMAHGQGAIYSSIEIAADQTEAIKKEAPTALSLDRSDKAATENRASDIETQGITSEKNTAVSHEYGKYGAYKGPVTGTKHYYESLIAAEKNVRIEFSNGLVFSYFNGEATAWYDNEAAKIQGKYIITFPGGTAKISYNPEGGTAWWVFENR